MIRRRMIDRLSTRLARRYSLPWMLEWPQTLQIVPTNGCNLRCQACPKTVYATDSRHMIPEVYRRIREEALPHVSAVHLQGLGEPTLSPLFAEMVEDAIRHHLALSFVTNGTRLTDEHIRLLGRATASVAVSIDGATKSTHEFSKAGSDFDQILETLSRLDTARRANANRLALHFSTVVTRHNVMEIPGIVRLAARYGVASVALLVPGMGNRSDEFAQASIGFHESLYHEQLPAIRAAEKSTGVVVQYPPYLSSIAGGGTVAANRGQRKRRIFPQKCFAPFQEMYIDVDGWVKPCCRALWISMGNVLDMSVRSIWNNRHYGRLRQLINTNNPPEFCRDCALSSGITAGDEKFLERRYAKGMPPLPRGAKIGYVWSAEEGRVVEAGKI